MIDEILSIFYDIIQFIPGTVGGMLLLVISLILFLYIVSKIYKKIKNRTDGVYETFDNREPQDKILKEIIPYDTIEKEFEE